MGYGKADLPEASATPYATKLSANKHNATEILLFHMLTRYQMTTAAALNA